MRVKGLRPKLLFPRHIWLNSLILITMIFVFFFLFFLFLFLQNLIIFFTNKKVIVLGYYMWWLHISTIVIIFKLTRLIFLIREACQSGGWTNYLIRRWVNTALVTLCKWIRPLALKYWKRIISDWHEATSFADRYKWPLHETNYNVKNCPKEAEEQD